MNLFFLLIIILISLELIIYLSVKILKKNFKWIIENADSSTGFKNDLIKNGVEDHKILVNPNGVDETIYYLEILY